MYKDCDDNSFEALKHWPLAFLDPQRRRSTLLADLPEDELAEGLRELEADYRSGRLFHLMERYRPLIRHWGDVTLLVGER